ncbi:MAG TPA: tyrosine-protein phosphatase [Mycobacterium sp.]|nr:tyrosine-protein phosphatase [Mycobacterium sp.]
MSGASIVLDVVTDPSPTRRLSLSGCFNFRDLGGYRTGDGRRIRWRRLFRADGLTRLDQDDCAILADLGLSTVIDLRTPLELEERGVFPTHHLEVEYHHLPLTDVLPPDRDLERYGEPVFVTDRYRQMFSEGSEALARAVRVLSAPGALPAVFHCSAGKDRTGILAALVLGFLGVPEAVIVEDYILSAEAMVLLMERLKAEYPDSAEDVERFAPAVTTVAAESMAAFLEALADEHGGFDDLAARWDLTDAVGRLRRELLEA